MIVPTIKVSISNRLGSSTPTLSLRRKSGYDDREDKEVKVTRVEMEKMDISEQNGLDRSGGSSDTASSV